MRVLFAAVLLTNSVTAATIGVQGPAVPLGVGTSAAIAIGLADVVDVYAFQIDVLFDPSIVSIAGQSEGGFLFAGGPTFFVPGTIDNVGGSVTFVANTLLGPLPGVSGDGVIVTLDVLGLGAGMSTLGLSNVILLDSALSEIAVDVVPGTITVDSAVPEPGAWSYCGLGLLALGIRQRRNDPR